MMYRSYLTAILCVTILAGCATTDRYALSKDDEGRLVRLDTQTGEVMLIKDGQLTPENGKIAPKAKPKPKSKSNSTPAPAPAPSPVPMPTSTPAPAPTPTPASATPTSEISIVTLPNGGRAWPAHTISGLGNTKAALTTYWYNGKLHFGLELYPMSKRLNLLKNGYYNNASFSLAVNDKAGKRIASTLVSATRLKQTMNKMRNMEELSAEGAILMTKQKYDSLADWQLQWNP